MEGDREPSPVSRTRIYCQERERMRNIPGLSCTIGEIMMHKKAILFDLDGTLWDSAVSVSESWNEALKDCPDFHGVMTPEKMYTYMGLPMVEIARRFFEGIEEERALELLHICEKNENDYIRRHGGVLMADLEETLKDLHGKCFLAIVSNCQAGYIEAFLAFHGLEGYFDDFESNGGTGLLKADNIRLVLKRNGISDEEAVYVGDTMGDYEAAEEAGIEFIHASYGFGSVPDGTAAIKSLPELKEII